jgi:hypothetical protein
LYPLPVASVHVVPEVGADARLNTSPEVTIPPDPLEEGVMLGVAEGVLVTDGDGVILLLGVIELLGVMVTEGVIEAVGVTDGLEVIVTDGVTEGVLVTVTLGVIVTEGVIDGLGVTEGEKVLS